MSSGIRLKLDNSIKRENDRGTRNVPVDPLTASEKAMLKDRVWKECKSAYINRMVKSALMADYDEIGDLANDAWIFFENILNKFDKNPYKGKIAEYDISGADKPKSLEFYFTNYFSHRVNYTACEARTDKKLRGIGPAENMDEQMYDPEDTGSDFSQYKHRHEITGEIFAEVGKKDKEFQRFFQQLCVLQCTQKELREEYKEKFKIHKAVFDDMVRRLENKYKFNIWNNSSNKK